MTNFNRDCGTYKFNCIICGKASKTWVPAIYCSYECCWKAENKRYKLARSKRRAAKTTCKGCGGPMAQVANDKPPNSNPWIQVTGRYKCYCSAACRQRAYRQRAAGASVTIAGGSKVEPLGNVTVEVEVEVERATVTIAGAHQAVALGNVTVEVERRGS